MRRRKRERERRGVKVLYGVLNGSCIQAAVISGHPLWCVHLYTCDFHSKYSRKKTRKFSANNRLCRPVTMTCCSTRWRDSFRQSAVNSRCSLTRLTYPTVQLPQSSIDWSAFRAFKLLRVSSADREQKIGDSFTETWSCYKVLRGEWCIHTNLYLLTQCYTSSLKNSFTCLAFACSTGNMRFLTYFTSKVFWFFTVNINTDMLKSVTATLPDCQRKIM